MEMATNWWEWKIVDERADLQISIILTFDLHFWLQKPLANDAEFLGKFWQDVELSG